MSEDLAPLVNLLTVGQSFSALYFAEHPRVRNAADEFIHRFRLHLASAGRTSLEFGTVKRRLVHDGKMMVGPTLIARRLIDCLESLRAGGIRLEKDLTVGELLEFFDVAGGLTKPVRDYSISLELFRSHHIKNIKLLQTYGLDHPTEGEEEEGVEELDGSELSNAIDIYQSLFEVVEQSHGRAERGADVDVNHSRSTVETMLQGLQNSPEQLMKLSCYPDYDSYTIGHSVRVALLALLVGRNLSLQFHELVELGTAALLHDVGKSRIPPEVLFKEGRLTDDERTVMMQHAWLGGEILLESEDATNSAIGAAFGHHISHDRSGYPPVPAWMKVGPYTSLVQVCDVFEALTAVRPYKLGFSPAQAYRMMLEDYKRFHPGMLHAFISAIGLYPPGTNVSLEDGTSGIVLRPGTGGLDRPVVRLSGEEHGDTEVDLSHSAHEDRKIIRITIGEDRHFESDQDLSAPLPEPVCLDPCHDS